MTEYDYSPDAIERYYAKQESVARWIDRQAYEASRYGNPFLPENNTSAGAALKGSSPTGANANGIGRSLPRSVSTPPVDPYGHSRHGHGYEHRTGHTSHRSSSNSISPTVVQPHRYPACSGGGGGGGTSSHSRSQSHSQTTVYSGTNAHARSRPPPPRSQTYAHAMASASVTHLPAPSRSQTLPAQLPTTATQPVQYTGAPGQTVVMQNGRSTYVVVPPHGTRVQVCSPQSTSPTRTAPPAPVPVPVPTPVYPHTQATYKQYPSTTYVQPVSPTRDSGKKPPLLKRLFGAGSNTHFHSNSNTATYRYEYGQGYGRRSGSTVPVNIHVTAGGGAGGPPGGARRRTTSMHY